jgi:hypothetical protein
MRDEKNDSQDPERYGIAVTRVPRDNSIADSKRRTVLHPIEDNHNCVHPSFIHVKQIRKGYAQGADEAEADCEVLMSEKSCTRADQWIRLTERRPEQRANPMAVLLGANAEQYKTSYPNDPSDGKEW